MSEQGGPSYDSFRVNAMQQAAQGGGQTQQYYMKDQQMFQGLSSQGKGLNINNKIGGGAGISSVIGQKGPRTLAKATGALGIRNTVQFDGEIKPMTDGLDGGQGQGQGGEIKTEDVMGKGPTGPDGQPINNSQGVGLDEADHIKEAEKVYGSRFAHKIMHNQMPMPNEFIAPTRLNPMEMSRLFGEAASDGGGGGGGGATYNEVYGSGQTIIQNGGELRGSLPEAMLTGQGAIQAPNTPSTGKTRERDTGMGV